STRGRRVSSMVIELTFSTRSSSVRPRLRRSGGGTLSLFRGSARPTHCEASLIALGRIGHAPRPLNDAHQKEPTALRICCELPSVTLPIRSTRSLSVPPLMRESYLPVSRQPPVAVTVTVVAVGRVRSDAAQYAMNHQG